MYYILDEVVPYLPENKPTYLMGVGTQQILLRQLTEESTSLTVYILPEMEDTDMCIRIMES